MSAKIGSGQRVIVFIDDGAGGFAGQLGGEHAEMKDAIDVIAQEGEVGNTYSILKILRSGMPVEVVERRVVGKGVSHFAPRAPRKPKPAPVDG